MVIAGGLELLLAVMYIVVIVATGVMAVRRGRSAVLWTLLALVFNVFSLLVVFALRPVVSEQDMKRATA